PPLALVGGLGFITRALANWAAPAFISAVVVAVAILIRRGAWKWLALNLGIGACVQATLLISDAMATRLHVPRLAKGDVYNRTLGWRALCERAGARARQAGARITACELRDDVASLLYYWRAYPQEGPACPRRAIPHH